LALVVAPQASEGDFQARINAAIDRGVAWLQKRQRPDGTWDNGNNERFASGVAALGFLTLVKSGVGESDPSVQRCVRYLDGFRAFDRTYSTGVYVLAWESLKRGAVDKPKAEAAAKWLVEHRDPLTKIWAYPEGDVDLSNTQYAVLGLLAASRMGVDVPKDFLFESLSAIVKRQQKPGSFTYNDPNGVGTGSMTTAGILAFRVAAMLLKGHAPYEAVRRDWEARENAAFDWLDTHFRVDANPAGYTVKGMMRPYHYYYLYGLERACALAGRKKLGNRNWYAEGAAYLVDRQDPDGNWNGDLADTCFALLFLKRATLTWSPDPKAAVDTAASPPADPAARRPKAAGENVPFVKSWLVCGPFATKRTEPLSKDEIGEASVKSAADGENAGSSSKRWKRVETSGDHVILDKVLPSFDVAFAYAFTTVSVKTDQDAILWIGHDDGAKAWLNGKLVYENETYGEGVGTDTYFARVRLKKGVNTLLVKVFDLNYDCGLRARFATPEGGNVE
jgi:hypothetical protein